MLQFDKARVAVSLSLKFLFPAKLTAKLTGYWLLYIV